MRDAVDNARVGDGSACGALFDLVGGRFLQALAGIEFASRLLCAAELLQDLAAKQVDGAAVGIERERAVEFGQRLLVSALLAVDTGQSVVRCGDARITLQRLAEPLFSLGVVTREQGEFAELVIIECRVRLLSSHLAGTPGRRGPGHGSCGMRLPDSNEGTAGWVDAPGGIELGDRFFNLTLLEARLAKQQVYLGGVLAYRVQALER